MLRKAFQVILVTFLVIFTAAFAMVVLSAVFSLFFSNEINGGGGGVFVVRSIDLRFLKSLAIAIVFLLVAAVYLVGRRNRLR